MEPLLPPDEFAVVILSRKRSGTILKHTMALLPWATVTVDEAEAEDYAKVIDEAQIVPHPRFKTMADLRNWITDSFDAEFVIHVHDDLFQLRNLVGWRPRRYRDPETAALLLRQTAICARDAGCGMFGYGNIPVGTPHYDKMRPFKLNHYVRNVMGFVRGHGLRWDPRTTCVHDVDIGIESLLKHRIIWRDERWSWDDARLGSNAGGWSGIRTDEMLLAGRQALTDKWGPRYINFRTRRDWRNRPSTTDATIVSIPRRDPHVKNQTA